MTEKPLRMNESAPRLYHRDHRVSVRRGHVAFVTERHYDELMESKSYFDPCCGETLSSGDVCTRELPCAYHSENDSEPESDRDGEGLTDE